MENTVSHNGEIIRINDKSIDIKILSKSACAACHIKSACNMAEMQEKIVTLPNDQTQDFKVGDNVEISMSVGQGNKAMIFAYLIPAVILIAMIFILNACGLDQGLNALLSIATLVPYYVILYIFRNKIKEHFHYHLRKTNLPLT